MTNGSITKAILKAAKTQTGNVLYATAVSQMTSFPLSSYKLLYDQDEKKVAPDAWIVLLRAAIDTDKKKLEDCNVLLREAGLKVDRSYGRYREGK